MSKTTPAPPTALKAEGYASLYATSTWWENLANEPTPELRWPLSIRVFDRMRRQDAQVASVLRAVTSPIIRTQWRLDGTGCDPAVTELVASNVGLPIVGAEDDETVRPRSASRINWDEHLRLALLMLPFGHSPFERIFTFDESDQRWRISELGPRLPRTLSNISVDRSGNLVSIQQYGSLLGGAEGEPLTADRLVMYVLDREGGNWLGMPMLRSCYKNWLLKDDALRKWASAIDRQSMGVPIYTGAERETSLEAGQDIATNVRSGDNAGAAIPYGAKVELKGVEGTLPDIATYVQYQDTQIARSALGHFLNLGGQTNGQVGSYNLGTVLADTFHLSLDAVADLVATTATAGISEALVDVNFGKDVAAPRFVYDPIGTRQTELDRIREQAGLSSDADLVKFLRTIPTQEVA